MVVDIGISHFQAPGLFVFWKIFNGSSFCARSNKFNLLFVQHNCLSHILLYPYHVNVTKPRQRKLWGLEAPWLCMHARKQNSVLRPFTIFLKREVNSLHEWWGGGLSMCLEVVKSQKVWSGDFLSLLVCDWLLMHSPSLAKGDVLLGKRRKEGSGGGCMLTAVRLPNKLTRAGSGNGGPVQAVQRVMSLLLNY